MFLIFLGHKPRPRFAQVGQTEAPFCCQHEPRGLFQTGCGSNKSLFAQQRELIRILLTGNLVSAGAHIFSPEALARIRT